jgi:SAM-dependent methyltransferase
MTDPLDIVINVIPRIIVPADSALELELRFDIDERKPGGNKYGKLSAVQATTLIKNIIRDQLKKKAPCSIEQSINFISSNTKIKQLIFVDGIQQKEKQSYYEKQKILNQLIVNDKPQYKITMSFEQQIKEFSINTCQQARIKLRFSVEIGVWRLDMTLVRNIDTLSNPANLKTAKSKMLFILPINKFIDDAPWNYVHQVELEMEYIGDQKIITTKHVADAVSLIKSYVDSLSDGQVGTNPVADNEYQEAIYQIARIVDGKRANMFRSRFGLKQLSNQVIEMDKNIFLNKVLSNIEDYWITDKVDGKRAMIHINKDKAVSVSSDLKKLGESKVTGDYIFDTEAYEDGHYLFDVLVLNGRDVTKIPFNERYKLFSDAITASKKVSGLNLKLKPFTKLTKDFQEQIKKLKSTKKPFETDGYVLTPGSGMYASMKAYKYKPIDQLSVDFLVKKCPQKLLGVIPYLSNGRTLYLLYCGISKQVLGKLKMELMKQYESVFPQINKYYLPDYLPIQFDPSDTGFAYLYWSDDKDLDNTIGEFVVENPTQKASSYKWKLLRTRDDRQVELARGNYFGNNYKVAEMTWMSYQNPLVIETMDIDNEGRYFQGSESVIHKASRNFNSFAKTKIFEQFRETENVMDIASGKGQDLFRYAKNKMKNLTFIEIDKTAIMELIARKHDFSKLRSNESMGVLTQQLDLNRDYKINIQQLVESRIRIPPKKYELIVCNFAFHYLIADRRALVNIGKFVANYLKPGGRFVFTAFDGQEVVDLLEENGGEWKSDIKNKFHIIRDYSGTLIQPVGQKIKVLLPFSADAYYTEYLVHIDFIEAEFAKLGMVLETNQSFGEFLQEYERIDRKSQTKMDDDDRLYTSLYHYYGFYKNK